MLATGNPKRARGIAFLFVKHYKRYDPSQSKSTTTENVLCADQEQRANCVVWCALDLSKIDPVLRSVVLSKSAYALRSQFSVVCGHCFQQPAKEYVSLEALFTVSELKNSRILPSEITRHPDAMSVAQQAIDKRLPLCVVELRFFCSATSCQAALQTFKRSLNASAARPVCAFCKRSSDVKLQTCSRCGLAKYCNTECQKSHWSVHKQKGCVASDKSTSLTGIVYVQVIAGHQQQEEEHHDIQVSTATLIELTTPLAQTNVGELSARTVCALAEDEHERKQFTFVKKQPLTTASKKIAEAFCVLKRKDQADDVGKHSQCALCPSRSAALLTQVYHVDTEKRRSLDLDKFFLRAPHGSRTAASKTLHLLRIHEHTQFVTVLVMPVCESHRSATGLESVDAFLSKHAAHLLPGVAPP